MCTTNKNQVLLTALIEFEVFMQHLPIIRATFSPYCQTVTLFSFEEACCVCAHKILAYIHNAVDKKMAIPTTQWTFASTAHFEFYPKKTGTPTLQGTPTYKGFI